MDVALCARRLFRRFNRMMVLFWRLGFGPWMNLWPQGLGRYLVLHHRGRRSAARYSTPLNYAEIDGEIYIVAGFGAKTDWYLNLLAHPEAEVWLPDGGWQVNAHEISDNRRRAYLMRGVLYSSGFAAPLAGVNPMRLSDPELLAATTEYRLLHLERREALRGRRGPGDLSWTWLVGMPVIGLWLGRKLRRK